MKTRGLRWIVVFASLAFPWLAARWAGAAPQEPENLAFKAKVSASDQYDRRFAAQFAVDGQIP